MRKRSKLKSHINTLRNIKSIITAMKNLSLIEIGKVGKFSLAQKKVVQSIENTAADFFHFHPQLANKLQQTYPVTYIVIGSERGFCGDFNKLLFECLMGYLNKQQPVAATIITIGRKLAAKLEDNLPIAKRLDGPNTAEEIHAVILSLVRSLATTYPNSWIIIYNEESENGIQAKTFRLFERIEAEKELYFSSPPLLNLNPENFLTELLDQYLFAILYQIFYKSFMAENHARLQHMEGALQWLDKMDNQLKLQINMLRQEAITESIEEIMLSVEQLNVGASVLK